MNKKEQVLESTLYNAVDKKILMLALEMTKFHINKSTPYICLQLKLALGDLLGVAIVSMMSEKYRIYDFVNIFRPKGTEKNGTIFWINPEIEKRKAVVGEMIKILEEL